MSEIARIRDEMKTQGWSLVDVGGRIDGFASFNRTSIVDYLHKIKNDALPDEFCGVRHQLFTMQSLPKVLDVSGNLLASNFTENFHIDDCYIRALVPSNEPTTIFLDESIERSIPLGMALLITGTKRENKLGIPSTVHRRPTIQPNYHRDLLVIDFYETMHNAMRYEPNT